MSDDEKDVGGFSQKETIDQPGIIGARWWQESIATEVPRRKAIKALLTFGGALGVIGAVGYLASRKHGPPSSSSGPSGTTWNPDDATDSMKSALEMQKKFGWNFGATDDALVFDGTTTQPFDPAALDTMTTDLAPGNSAYTPYFIPTLFQAPSATPTSTEKLPNETAFKPLKSVMRPVSTPSTVLAFNRGKALAARVSAASKTLGLAMVVDLPGPDAVAFAAGAAGVFDPVFLFDNWPHPHGVVSSHLVLGAALYYQPLFAKSRAQSATAMPMFVLDRNRLATYVDSQREFDNRYTARLPSLGAMTTMEINHLLYIGPTALDRNESDDLNEPFLAFGLAGMKLHTCPAMAFTQASTADAGADTTWYYGGSATKNATFWKDFDHAPTVTVVDEVMIYAPTPRKTPFSSGYGVPISTPPRPENFGYIPVAVAVSTGLILGSRTSRKLPLTWNGTSGNYHYSSNDNDRSGSWNRSNYGSSSS